MWLSLSGLAYWAEVSCGPCLGSGRMHAEASCLASQILTGSTGLLGAGGGGKLSALCQMADFGGLRQGGRVKYSSKKRLMSVPPLNGNFTRELSHIP